LYSTHAKSIAEYARQDVANTVKVFEFVGLTIRQSLEFIPDQMQALQKDGLSAKCVWGHKRPYLEHVYDNKNALFDMVHSDIDRETLVCELTRIPGLGIAKASFVGQLTGHDTACLDSHNLMLMGLPPRMFRTATTISTELLMAKVKLYQSICDNRGTTQMFWDDWCDHVAKLRPRSFKNGYEVSALHEYAIRAC